MTGTENAEKGKTWQEFQSRKKRIRDAIQLQQPDRVPIAVYDEYYSLAQGGISPADAYYDPEKASKVFVEQAANLNLDMISLFGNFPGQVGETIGLTSNKWAGFHLPDTQEFQFVEKEYMLADEYDQFLQDPSDFVIRTMWPRMADGLKPFNIFPSFLMMAHGYTPITDLPWLMAQPEIREMFQKLLQIGEEYQAHQKWLDRTAEQLAEKGFPTFIDAPAHAPFDFISDYFRGIKGTMLDMYYHPDQLKAAIELITPRMIEYAVDTAHAIGADLVTVPLHRGADPFMSNEQFAEFYWPSLKELLLGILGAGLTPAPYWEGSYSNRLEFLAELPRGKVLSHFDVVDLQKARDILGDVMCFWGNVPIQTLISGSPQQTEDYVRELIDLFGPTGGLIIDGSAGIPKEARPENVRAMIEAVFQYGTY